MASRRVEMVSRELKRTLSRIIIYELNDPKLGFIAITKVTLTGDLRTAKVYVSVLGKPDAQEGTINQLRHARGYIQHLLGKQMGLKYLPTLSFYLDKSIEEDIQSDGLINQKLKTDGGDSCT